MDKSTDTRLDFRKEFYNKYVSTFHKEIWRENDISRKSDYEVYKRTFLPLLKDFNKDASIIELGCGSGYKLQFLKEQGYNNLYGIDISGEQIEKLKQRNIDGEVKNIFDFLNSSTKKYDIILAIDIIEHFRKEELINLFTGMKNLLNSNGLLLIHTPNGQSPFALNNIYGDLTHLTIFTQASLKQILSLTGYVDYRFYETGPTPKNFKGIIRFVLWRLIRLIFLFMVLVENGRKGDIFTQDFICTARKINEPFSLE